MVKRNRDKKKQKQEKEEKVEEVQQVVQEDSDGPEDDFQGH